MTQPTPDPPLEALARRFVRFADQECGDYAPFYARLARGIAHDPELLAIAAHTRSGQQAPNLLLAASAPVARLAGGTPLALIEVGASGGLNLLFDRYGYDYGAGQSAGDPGSPVRFTCTLHGEVRPPIPAGMPPVAAREGLDLHPIRATDPEAMRWLRALVWPEHPARAALLQQVLALARIKPTGRRYRQAYVVFLRAAGGKIAFLREYFDRVRAAQALDAPILGLDA